MKKFGIARHAVRRYAQRCGNKPENKSWYKCIQEKLNEGILLTADTFDDEHYRNWYYHRATERFDERGEIGLILYNYEIFVINKTESIVITYVTMEDYTWFRNLVNVGA